MKKWLIQLFVLFFSFGFSQQDQPKLVVGIIVDQMRYDYLYRYYDDYSEDGFKKLLNEGFSFQNTHFNYKPTNTAPGHASVYTGAVPSVHGIIGNYWYHKGENQNVYCTTDLNYMSVGIDAENKAGRMSPGRLKTTTVTDELKMFSNQRSKVIGISLKDRGAILPVGHFADAAYWMDENGKFISSTFYQDNLPAWVENYNAQNNAQKFINQGWNLLRPMSTYDESIEDNNRYERIFEPKTTPTFPYDLKSIADFQGNSEILKSSPYGNEMVADLSKLAIKNEELGQGEFTDFLAVSFSAPDYIGHNFGPRSIEIQDTYIRLDLTMANFIAFLDENVGKGNYLIFLTADHAAADNPNHLSDLGYKVRNVNRNDMRDELAEYIRETFGEDVFLNYSNQNIYLNEELIESQNMNYEQIVDSIRKYVLSKSHVARVYTRENVLNGNPADAHLTRISQGFDPKQNGDLVILLDPQYMEYYETGTTHGSTYMYDTHVPNLWYGWKIKHGSTPAKKVITQIAPTLSQLLNISTPNGSEGEVMTELFEE